MTVIFTRHHGAWRGDRTRWRTTRTKRGTTSVAWTRVFKHCSFKTTDFKPLKQTTELYACTVSVSVWEERTFFYIYIYAFSRRFYPKRLTLHSSYNFYILSALAFPGNRTHDLGVASAMLYHLSYRKAFFAALLALNDYINNYMRKNPRLCKYPHKHSDLGLKKE